MSWLPKDHGVRLGRQSTILSSGTFKLADSPSCSLEAWLTPARTHDSSTFLAFYTPENPLQLALRQYDTGFMVGAGTAKLGIDNVFRQGRPVFVTVTVSTGKMAVYIDGALAGTSPGSSLSGRLCTGQLVVGDSAVGTDTWTGRFQGLAIYKEALPAARVAKHYETWTRMGRPELAQDDGSLALYLFSEGAGDTVRNAVPAGVDLKIPERYLIVDQVLLEPFWSEYRRSFDYWRSVALNVGGLIPLGWCFYAYWTCVRPIRRPALATILLGGATSLTIEVLQAWLPTRSSGTMDLITNTLGTCLGVLLWRSALVQSLFAKAGVNLVPSRWSTSCHNTKI